MIISINPTYFCNFRCPTCYLSTNELSNTNKLDLNKLKFILDEIITFNTITHIDLYGGEIGLLPYDYIIKMENIINDAFSGQINIITNFSNIHEYFFHDNVDITVSYDYIYREHHEKVLSNIVKFNKPVHIIVLATDNIINNADIDIPIMNQIFSGISNIVSVEIKPYSSSTNNFQNSTYIDFENYIKKWMKLSGSYEFVNRKKIKDCISKLSSSYSDDHLYITPNGKIAVLEFKNDNEYFKELDSYDQFIEWSNLEKTELCKICKSCKFVGHCLSEHLKPVISLDKGCNGFFGLLNETMEI